MRLPPGNSGCRPRPSSLRADHRDPAGDDAFAARAGGRPARAIASSRSAIRFQNAPRARRHAAGVPGRDRRVTGNVDSRTVHCGTVNRFGVASCCGRAGTQRPSCQYPTSIQRSNLNPTSLRCATLTKPNSSWSATLASLGRAITPNAEWMPRARRPASSSSSPAARPRATAATPIPRPRSGGPSPGRTPGLPRRPRRHHASAAVTAPAWPRCGARARNRRRSWRSSRGWCRPAARPPGASPSASRPGRRRAGCSRTGPPPSSRCRRPP